MLSPQIVEKNAHFNMQATVPSINYGEVYLEFFLFNLTNNNNVHVVRDSYRHGSSSLLYCFKGYWHRDWAIKTVRNNYSEYQ